MGRGLDVGVLRGSAEEYRCASGPDLFRRTEAFRDWQEAHRALGLWPHGRTVSSPVAPDMSVRLDTGKVIDGIGFLGCDSLSLGMRSDVLAAAHEAINRCGVHSAGPMVSLGRSEAARELERELADFLKTEEIVLYPDGLSAVSAVLHGLIQPEDHVLIDAHASRARQQVAGAATGRLHIYPPRDIDWTRRLLARIRARDTVNAILIVADALGPTTADTPDLPALQEAAREYGAFLLVDVTQDLGAVGQDGAGVMEMQGILGNVDIVTGSFARTFVSNGGFVATRSAAARQYLSWFDRASAESDALSPSQIATIRAALTIVRSIDGRRLRNTLLRNAIELRIALAGHGLQFLGIPSPILPVFVGGEDILRIASGIAIRLGIIVETLEFPAVARGQARFRLSLMATHRSSHLERCATALRQAIDQAVAVRARLDAPGLHLVPAG